MKAKELKNKSAKELNNDLADLRLKYAKELVDSRTREVKNVKSINAIKKDIARVLTVLRELQIEGETK